MSASPDASVTSSVTPLLDCAHSGGGGGGDTPMETPRATQEEVYKRKRITLHDAEEGGVGHHTGDDDDDDGDDSDGDDDAPPHGWPTTDQLIRRTKSTWNMLRFSTVVKVFLACIIAFLIIRSISHHFQDRHKASHFTIVALLRDMSADPEAQDRWQFAFQWSALMSWSRILLGRNILVFVDTDETCNFLEGRVRGIQCFVIPHETCFHKEYQKPRLDCIFAVAHDHAPTDTIVYINGDVLVGPDLSETIRVVQSKYDRFMLSGRRTDLAVTMTMVEELRSHDFLDKLLSTAKTAGHRHKPDAIDIIVYQQSEFKRNPALGNFPAFLAAAPYWEAWFLSTAILDDDVHAIDISESAMLVHLDRGKPSRAMRVGAAYNEELARSLVGNGWKVGANIENAELSTRGDCTIGAATIAETDADAPPRAVPTRVGDGFDPIDTSRPLLLSPGCHIIPNPNVTDLVLLTRRASSDGFLVIIGVSSPYLTFAHNWQCWIDRSHFTHYVFLAMDQFTYRYMKARHLPVVLPTDIDHLLEKQPITEPGTIAHQRLIKMRTEYVMQVLESGFSAIAADVDTIWLTDPLPHLDPHFDLQGPPQSAPVIIDPSKGEDDMDEPIQEYTGSFIAVRATTYGRYYWSKVLQCERTNMADLLVSGDDTPLSSVRTRSACINQVASTLSAESRFSQRFLDPYLFPSSTSFFHHHASQLHGIVPIVIYDNDSSLNLNVKVRRLRDWGLLSIGSETGGGSGDSSDECLVDHLMTPPEWSSTTSTASTKKWHLKIRVLTYNRPSSLSRLLTSLESAAYDGDSVELEISVDHPIPTPDDDDTNTWSDTLELAHKFQWSHGTKLVIEQEHNIGLVGQWTRGWTKPKEDELCLFVEDDVEVTPGYYTWLRQAIETYYIDPANYDPRLFGISLQRQHTILGETHTIRYGSQTPSDVLLKSVASSSPRSSHLYKYQLLGTWGALFFPRHWKTFLKWLEEKKVHTSRGMAVADSRGDGVNTPCVPTLLSNKWWKSNPHRTWSQWFIRFVYEKGWYSLYTNFPEGGTLALNHREAGLTYRTAKGSMHNPIMSLTSDHLTFPPSQSIRIYDFHFNLVPHPEVLPWRSSLTNEKYLSSTTVVPTLTSLGKGHTTMVDRIVDEQCWTLDEMIQQAKREAEVRRLIVRERFEEAIAQAKASMEEQTPPSETIATAATTTAAKKPIKKITTAAGGPNQQSTTITSTPTIIRAKEDAPKATEPTVSGPPSSELIDPMKQSGREWDDHVHAPADRIRLRKEELTLMAALPDKSIGTFFDPDLPETIRHRKYMSSVTVLLNTHPKSSYLTVSDGGRFGQLANFIQEGIDKKGDELAQVAASDIIDATLVIAKDRLKKVQTIHTLNPSKMSLKDASIHWVVGMEMMTHVEAPIPTLKEMLRVSKKDFPAALRTALEPLSGTRGVGSGMRMDLSKLAGVARDAKCTMFVKVFRDADDLLIANRQTDAGGRPWSMMTVAMFKKPLTKTQTATFVKAGFIELPITAE